MSEKEKESRHLWRCIKYALISAPFAAVATILLWASIQPVILPRGWIAPDIFYRFAPVYPFSENIGTPNTIYVAILLVIIILFICSIRGAIVTSSKLSDAKLAASKRRLEDES